MDEVSGLQGGTSDSISSSSFGRIRGVSNYWLCLWHF